MQGRKTQAARREETQRLLVSAARRLFAEKGYAATGTPEIVAAAGVTRGALYHHFEDKKALFRTVVEQEHLLLAMSINAAAKGDDDEAGPVKALVAGSDAFIGAMKDPGRRQIMLVDGPAVLGQDVIDEIDARHGMDTLTRGLRYAMNAGAIKQLPLAPLAHLLSAMFDRAALATPEESGDYGKAIKALIRGLKV